MTDFKYTRIVSYGCSFTAGSELTDHDVIGISENELLSCVRKNKYSGSKEIYDHYNVDEETRKKILKSNRTKSWPNYIANYYNVPLLNRAIPGSSLSHATYCLLRDIHSKTIQPTDLVLIGITSPNRWFQFTKTGKPFYGVFNRGWTYLEHPLATENYRKELEKNWYNVYNLIYTHYKEILFLSNLSNSMNKQIKLCYAIRAPSFIQHLFPTELPQGFLRNIFPNEFSTTSDESNESTFFDFCHRLIPYDNFIDPEISLSELSSWKDVSKHHAFGHPRVELHKQFADMLINKMEQQYD